MFPGVGWIHLGRRAHVAGILPLYHEDVPGLMALAHQGSQVSR